jgi:threonine dehydrogenase-like Zn-dependent dehydrogenase
VCASSLPLWEGREWFDYPQPAGAPGHEGWGRVAAVGEGVPGVAVGDRVAALTYRAHAEYDIADAGAVVPLPGIAGRCRCRASRWAAPSTSSGAASSAPGRPWPSWASASWARILTRLAARAGARVIAISRRPFALEVARAMGAAHTIAMDDHGRIVEEVRRLTAGAMCERVIEAVGLQWPLDLAGEITGERGRLVIAGYHQDGKREVNLQMWNWRGIDVINAHERDPRAYVQGIREAVDLMAAGVLDPAPLFTHRLPLDRLGEALELTRTRPDGFMKAVVTA